MFFLADALVAKIKPKGGKTPKYLKLTEWKRTQQF